MKIIKQINQIIIAIILLLILNSCKFNLNISDNDTIDGNGKVIIENRRTDVSFNTIQSENGLEVIIEKSDSDKIIVEADSNLQKHIITSVKNDTLYIKTDTNINDYTSKKIYITFKQVNALVSKSGSTLSSKKILEQENLKINSNSGSTIKLVVATQKISCESSSGSSITIKGKTLFLVTKSSSGSTINANGLISEKVVAVSNSGSQTNVYPIESLNANASSGSTIIFYNIPKVIDKSESSGASISKS